MLSVSTELLQVLRAVAASGSFTAAAVELGFTQSAVSKQVLALEARVGAPLFARGARGVALTPAGAVLAGRADRILGELERLERDLADVHEALSGRVALGGFPASAMQLVPRTIERLGREHAGIAVDFVEASTPRQLSRLRSGRLDLVVIGVGDGLADYDLTGVVHEELASGPLLVAVGDRHRFAGRGRVSVHELVGELWIAGSLSRGEPQFGAWPGLPSPVVRAEIATWTTRLGFVAAGLGITTIPSLALGVLPAGVTAVRVDDPGWRGRRLLLAWIGALSPESTAVREALHAEAEAIAAAAAGLAGRSGRSPGASAGVAPRSAAGGSPGPGSSR